MKMEKKLEITAKLEKMARKPVKGGFRNRLRESVAILNLPAPYYCEKGCHGCVTRVTQSTKREREGRLPISRIKESIDFFVENWGTKFISILGRGAPFHPEVIDDTLEKISYARSKGLQAYLFYEGSKISEELCASLAENEVNVMISLFGNQFMNANFFRLGTYGRKEGEIAQNIWRLISCYLKSPNQPEEGTTRIGMNYVVSPSDLGNPAKLWGLKEAANEYGLFFVCNTNFHFQPFIPELRKLARENSNFGLSHSTFVDGRCQKGAGSSITIAANGDIHRCPYMMDGGDGNITELSEERIRAIVLSYLSNREYSCILRKT